MKKIICLMFTIVLTFAFYLPTYAQTQEPYVIVVNDKITLIEGQNEFTSEIEIEPHENFAGVELAFSCPEGVAVTSATSSAGSMSAQPVLANDGLYWTGFFESDNILFGSVSVLAQMTCEETFKSGTVTLETVKVFTKNGAKVEAQEIKVGSDIIVARQDSITTPNTGDSEQNAAILMLTIFLFSVLVIGFLVLMLKKSNKFKMFKN